MSLRGIWSAIKRLNPFKSKPSTNPNTPTPPIIVVPPTEPIPEIPTPEEVENFPNSPIPDFFFADISHYIKKFDPVLYKESFKDKGTAFIIHKTTQGLSMVDDKWAGRKIQCRKEGLPIMGYHFWECYKDPYAQANHYVINHGVFELNPIFDFESIPGKKGMELKDFIKDQEQAYICLKQIQKMTGKTPIIYSNRLEIENMNLPEKWSEFYWWFSRYNSFLGATPSPAKPERVLGWQYKELKKNYTSYPSSFPGIGDCDCNIYYGQNNVLNFK